LEPNKLVGALMPVLRRQKPFRSVSVSRHVRSDQAAPLGSDTDGGQPNLRRRQGIRSPGFMEMPVREAVYTAMATRFPHTATSWLMCH
jgi:hypothetical protein